MEIMRMTPYLCMKNDIESANIDTEEGRLQLAIRVKKLPFFIRRIIVDYLKDLIRTMAPIQPQRLLDCISIVVMSAKIRQDQQFICDKTYYDFCRGYCMKCGNPAGVRVNGYGKKSKLRLPAYGLAIMGLCNECLKYGFGFLRYPFAEGGLDPLYHFPNHDERVRINLSFAIEVTA